MLARGGPASRDSTRTPQFAAGDRVRTRNINPTGHTRLPRYARNHAGAVTRVHGCHVFPDANAHGLGEQPQPLYQVRFEARELWGEKDAGGKNAVHLDLWEDYLEPA
jgi:nitrile hydratase